jgi:hypothetical protein
VDRKVWIIGGIAAAVLLVVLVIGVRNRNQAPRAAAARPPEVVGRPVPDATFEIDFAKRYDLHCFPGGTQAVVLRRCKIVGSTGPGSGAGRLRLPGADEDYVLPGTFSGRWLVVELPDGRHAYVPQEAVRLIEESPEAK